ncbi:MAG TPA: DUF3592 domain-containing protein [Chthoniobacteraceae bacterium]|nr:DUF3592 domain-containing protein [Chthoniobacteraceae bacterium]
MFGFLTAVGLVLLFVLGLAITKSVAAYFWTATPCTIIESHRSTDGLEATTPRDEPLVIKYRYDAGGKTRHSTTLERGLEESLNSRQIERLLMKHQVGTTATCYVNPRDPEESVLRRGPLWVLALLILPLALLGVGLGGLIGIWRGKRGIGVSGHRRHTSTKEFGTVGKLLFFGLFALVGGILTFFLVVVPLRKYFAARNWPETPCEILSSSVASHSGKKGSTTYSVDITYRYQVAGRDYWSDTYSLMSGSSSGRTSKENEVAKFPAGSRAVCYVNPEDPTDALLNRGLSWWLALGLIPTPFLAVGLIGLGSVARSALRDSRGVLSTPTLPGLPNLPASVPVLPTAPVGPVELKPEASPLFKLGGAIFVAIIWNGITGVFATFAVNSFVEGKPEWFLAIFITPFVLIGLVLLGLIGSTFLNLFNPRVRLTVNSQAIPLGGTLEATWAFTSSSSRIKHLKIILEGHNERTTGHGKNRRTQRDVFATLPLVDTVDPQQIAQGRASLQIPDSQRPSDDEGGRKVIWALKVVGEIPRFPDVEDEFDFTVLAHTVR